MDNHMNIFLSDIIKQIVNEILNLKDTILTEPEINATDTNKNSMNISKLLIKSGIIIKNSFSQDRFTQIKVHYQHSHSLCGFHSLFNMINFQKFLTENNSLKKMYFLKRINSSAKFWKFYQKCLKLLLQNANLDEYDRKDLSEYGPLDLSHLQYLLNNHDKQLKIVHKKDIICLFYDYGYFQCSIERIISVQEYFEDFYKDLNKKTCTVFLGIKNHWLTLVIVKEDKERCNYYFMDSKNKEELNDDTKFLLETLINQGNLKSIYINTQLNQMLKSFLKFVTKDNLQKIEFAQFFNWISNEFTSRALQDDIVNVIETLGKMHICNSDRERFLNWFDSINNNLDKSKLDNYKIDDRQKYETFFGLLERVKGLVK